MAIKKSWLFTAVFSLACAGVSASVAWASQSPGAAVSAKTIFDALFWIRVGAALFGAFCLARFIVGAPAAMAGPPPQSILTQAPGAHRVVFKARISSNGHFFTLIRGFQIIAALLCLMAQFVSIEPPAKEAAGKEAVGYCPVPHENENARHKAPARPPLTT